VIYALVALALAAVAMASVAVVATRAWGEEKAGRVYSDQARIAAMKEVELAHGKVRQLAADRDGALAEARVLREMLDEVGVDVPAGRGVVELRAGLRRAADRAVTATGAETDAPRVSHDAPTPAAAAGGSLARGGLPGGRG
jgi:hypothetical protein